MFPRQSRLRESVRAWAIFISTFDGHGLGPRLSVPGPWVKHDWRQHSNISTLKNGRFLANGRQMKSLKKMKTESAKIALKNGALLGWTRTGPEPAVFWGPSTCGKKKRFETRLSMHHCPKLANLGTLFPSTLVLAMRFYHILPIHVYLRHLLVQEQRMIRSLGGVAPHLLDRGKSDLLPHPGWRDGGRTTKISWESCWSNLEWQWINQI